MLPPGARFHYSNLAFALLGVVVERVSGMPYAQYVAGAAPHAARARRARRFDPEEPAATGYLVQPYVEGVWDEAPVETGAWIAAGQMWGTVRRPLHAGRRSSPQPDESVLARATVEEMRTVQTIDDHVRWTRRLRARPACSLRDGERILAGPRRLDARLHRRRATSRRPTRSASRVAHELEQRARSATLAKKLVAATVERWPVPPEPWKVEEPPPDDVVPLLGIWFMEGDAFTMRWKDGKLDARFPDDPDWKPSAVLRARGRRPLAHRVGLGAGRGAPHRARRTAASALVLAGYPVTREPRSGSSRSAGCGFSVGGSRPLDYLIRNAIHAGGGRARRAP